MKVAENLIFEPSRSLLVWSSQIETTTVTLETLLVVVAVLVPDREGTILGESRRFLTKWTITNCSSKRLLGEDLSANPVLISSKLSTSVA